MLPALVTADPAWRSFAREGAQRSCSGALVQRSGIAHGDGYALQLPDRAGQDMGSNTCVTLNLSIIYVHFKTLRFLDKGKSYMHCTGEDLTERLVELGAYDKHPRRTQVERFQGMLQKT